MKTLEEIKKNLAVSVNDEDEDGIAGFVNLHDKKGKIARFIASWGGGWDHVSVSYPNRCPTWDEMHAVKDMFFEDEEVCVQYHPAKSDYVNVHPYCLHIWKPQGMELPKPPRRFVG